MHIKVRTLMLIFENNYFTIFSVATHSGNSEYFETSDISG